MINRAMGKGLVLNKMNERYYQEACAVMNEVKKVVIGKDECVRLAMAAILAGGHILIDDIPGVGKTTLAMAFAGAMEMDSHRMQFTPDVLPADILGFSMYEKAQGAFVYQPGAIMCNLFLADEINRTSSKTQSALLDAMAAHRVTVDAQTYDLPTPFVVLATQNPTGSAGTTLLPSSQLDRFLIRLSMGYPDHRSQINILRDRHSENPLDRVQPVVTKDELLQLIQEARTVEANDRIFDYVTTLAEATRTHPMVELGVSPRGALALCRMAKAHAFLAGRDYAVPEDVAAVFPDVCAHRLILSAKARMMEEKAENILAEILKSVDMPVLKA